MSQPSTVTPPATESARRRLVVGLARYRTVGLCLAVIAGLVALLPPAEEPGTALAAGRDGGRADGSSGTGRGPGSGDGDDDGNGGGDSSVTTDGSGPGGGGAGAGGPSTTGTANGAGAPNDPASLAGYPDCDPATGRIRFPSVFAPPCVAVPTRADGTADNGGATYPGVTADTITVVHYRPRVNPAVSAVLRAAGLQDSPVSSEQSYRDWVELFGHEYQTYGRRIDLRVVDGTSDGIDPVTARADAIQIATTIGPFAVFGATEPMIDELANRGIVTITQLTHPDDYFAAHDPFSFGTQMTYTQTFRHLAEYLLQRLVGRPARFAGDERYRSTTRRIGLLYADTAAGTYRPATDLLRDALDEAGAPLVDVVSYDPAGTRVQETARVLVARLKDADVTSLVYAGDPIAPIYFTQEATRQGWFPEWIIAGGTLSDSNLFGRAYDQRQWAHAFGLSQLWPRPPYEQTEPYHQHVAYFGRPPASPTASELVYQEVLTLATGIHLAGPHLDPITFRDGLFAYPPSGGGRITTPQRSWGDHGIWPATDHTAFDTVAEVWWDPDATGEDEFGNVGIGMFRYVDGGRRYRLGEWPATEPAVFDRSGSLTQLATLPDGDRYPTYPDD